MLRMNEGNHIVSGFAFGPDRANKGFDQPTDRGWDFGNRGFTLAANHHAEQGKSPTK
jgi:hypothetical protein